MADLNIDDFFKDSAKALNLLYQSFPRKITLYVDDIVGVQEPDEFGMPNDRHMACLASLLWLGDEGYLRFDETIRHEALDQVVLTGHCFTLLTRPPALERQLIQIDALRNALKNKSSSEIRTVMLDMMTDLDQRPIR